jgi:IMP dehydrogenase
VREVLALTRQHRISGFPVVEAGQVVGIVTNRDLRFETAAATSRCATS